MPRDKAPTLSKTCLLCRQKLANQLKLNTSSEHSNLSSNPLTKWKVLCLETFSMLFGLPVDHPVIQLFHSNHRDENNRAKFCNRCLDDVANVHYVFWQLQNLELKLSEMQAMLFGRLRLNYEALPMDLVLGHFMGTERLNPDLRSAPNNLNYDEVVKIMFEEIKSTKNSWPKPNHAERWRAACQNADKLTKESSSTTAEVADELEHTLVKIEVDPTSIEFLNIPVDQEMLKLEQSTPTKTSASQKSEQSFESEEEINYYAPEDEEDDFIFEDEGISDDEDWVGETTQKKRKPKRKLRSKSVSPAKPKVSSQPVQSKLPLENTRFLCTEDPDNCTKTYGSRKHLRDHVQKFHIDRKFPCPETGCLSKFRTDALLTQHKQKVHFIPRPKVICEICGISLDPKDVRKHYFVRHQGQGKYCCEHCSLDFSNQPDYNSHLNLHQEAAKEYPFLCVVCQQLFTNSMDLKSHVTSNHLSSGLKCPICGIMKPNDFLLQRHIKIHDRVKQFMCNECGRAFATRAYLKYHEDHYHTNAGRRYPCEICGKEFLHQKNVMRHLISHQAEKPYKCKICEKTFNYSHLLKKHEEIHSGTKNYECHLCGKRFRQEQNLRQHMKCHRPKPEKDGAVRRGSELKLTEDEEPVEEISYEIHHQDQGEDKEPIPVILQVKGGEMQQVQQIQSQLIPVGMGIPGQVDTSSGEAGNVIEATLIPGVEGLGSEGLGGLQAGQYETVQEIQLTTQDFQNQSQTATVVFLYEYNA